MATNDVYRASINTKVDGVNCLNNFHFIQIDSDGAEVPPDSLKAALETILLPDWVPFLSPQTVVESVIITRVMPTPTQPFSYLFAGGAGTNAGGHGVPPNLAVVLSHYSTLISKRGRGRTYLAGLDKACVEAGVVKAAAVTLIATFVATLKAQIMDAGSLIHWQWVHFSPTNVNVYTINHVEQRMQLRVLRERNRN